MKYIKFTVKVVVLLLFQMLMTVIGWVVIPFFLKRVEEFDCEHGYRTVRFRDKWFDNIFGNSEDGIDGDSYYYQKIGGRENCNLWTRYNWVAFRNPIHNLALSQGVNEVIVAHTWHGNRYTEDRIGHEGYCYSVATGESGREYKMIRWCKLWNSSHGIEFNFGYKNFNIQEVNKHYKYSFTVSVNPFKKFEE